MKPSDLVQPELDFPDNISEIPPAQEQNQKSKRTHSFLGGLHLTYTMYFFIPLLIFACLFSYHMAVSSKQEHPFPHTTITNTACHYPQDIVFRWLMLSAGSFIVIFYFILFRWLDLQKEKTKFPYGTEQWLFKWALASVIGFYCAIGTVDGAGYPQLHQIGAIFFFIVLFIVAGAVTLVVNELYNWDPQSIGKTSIVAKKIVFGYLIGVVIYCIIGGIMESIPHNEDSDIYQVIVEWNLTLSCLVWLFTFVFDFRDIFLTLRGDVMSTLKQLEPEQI